MLPVGIVDVPHTVMLCKSLVKEVLQSKACASLYLSCFETK